MHTLERDLRWEGCFNVRDLGGFPTRSGGTTAWGAVVRSDSPAALTDVGWAALRAHGVKTILDLRDPSEREVLPPLADLAIVHVPVVDLGDDAFFGRWRGTLDTPRFYREVLEHWQHRFAAAVVAVARAGPGGTLIHCQLGRDRTGLVAALLLSLVGVPAEEVAWDYALSAERLRPFFQQLASKLEDEAARERLHRENASDPAWMLGLLDDLDIETYLALGGASRDDFDAVRTRLVPQS
jgi:protein tyrosine/serine phosphatase